MTPQSTLDDLTAEDLAACYDQLAKAHVDTSIMTTLQPELRQQTDRALFEEPSVLPKVEIVWIGCGRSLWVTVWATLETRRLLAEHRAAGRTPRDIRFINLPQANHFVGVSACLPSRRNTLIIIYQVHWDDPDTLLATFKGFLQAP
jgi:hypothetical protein